MDTGEIERELEDLETRMERLRALYEQYFMGIEKLEPQIPKKDVERKIQVLRREQIRNTALRFKFQMLVQRYNTLQQHWMRVTREIENGTYRRDVMRAAARFGEKEAVTILGKKKAAKYAALAAAQEQQKNKQRGGSVEDTTELDAADIIEDDAAPSSRHAGRAPAAAATPPPPAAAAPRRPASVRPEPPAMGEPPKPPAQPARAPTPIPAAATSNPRTGQRVVAGSSADPVSAIRPSPDDAKRRVAELAAEMKRASASQKSSFGALDLDFEEAAPKAVAVGAPPVKSNSAPPANASKPAITAKVAAPPTARPRADAPPSAMFGALDMPFETGPSAPPAARPTAGSATASPPPSGPRNVQARLHVPPTPRSDDASAIRPAATAQAAKPAAAAAQPAKPAAAVSGASSRAAVPPARPSAPDDPSLPDQRIRQIYAKYVEAKRAAQESTASVTYDKLAAKLRAEAAKLRTAHPAKSIDYEVVMKDGKPHLKPVLR